MGKNSLLDRMLNPLYLLVDSCETCEHIRGLLSLFTKQVVRFLNSVTLKRPYALWLRLLRLQLLYITHMINTRSLSRVISCV